NFTQVGTAPAGATTFTDINPDGNGVPAGTYYYRVKAFATRLPDSAYSNVDSVRFVAPGSPLTVDHPTFNSHNDVTINGSARVTPNAAPVGTFAGHQDIGPIAAAGGATFDAATGTYTVNTSTYDIWDTSDSFHYVYKPLVGDGEIVARAVSLQSTDFWTK